MSIGNKIAQYRKNMNITQDTLAQKLGVTNQAVSKWESEQSCPDIQLLSQLADIFGVTIDELFGRQPKVQAVSGSLPWEDDDTLRVVLYHGHRLMKNTRGEENLTFTYEGEALNVQSAITVNCGDVDGDVDAGGTVNCGSVGGDVDAGGSVNCADIGGDADAGADIHCGNVGGDVDAGCNVECGDVDGDVDAGGSVQCGAVSGDVDAGGNIVIQK